MTARPRTILVVLLAIGIAISPSAAAPIFVAIGRPSGAGGSYATALSADGRTVVGNTDWNLSGTNTSWTWTLSAGMNTIQVPVGSAAFDVSSDGQTVVGRLSTGQVFRRSGGVVSPLALWCVPPDTYARGVVVSPNGDAVGGVDDPFGSHGAVWRSGVGVTTLQVPLTAPWTWGQTYNPVAVSTDGQAAIGRYSRAYTIVIGSGEDQQYIRVAEEGGYSWSAGAVELSPSALPEFDATPNLGMRVGGSGSATFLRSAVGGAQVLGLPSLPPGVTNVTPRISADGTTVVSGVGMWTATSGPRTVEQVLTAWGCNPTGWSNLIVTDVSSTGQAICGFGTNPAGLTEAWYAGIPAPGASWVALVALAVGARRRRR